MEAKIVNTMFKGNSVTAVESKLASKCEVARKDVVRLTTACGLALSKLATSSCNYK